DELLHLLLAFAAEGALQQVSTLSTPRHAHSSSPVTPSIGHHKRAECLVDAASGCVARLCTALNWQSPAGHACYRPVTCIMSCWAGSRPCGTPVPGPPGHIRAPRRR